MYFTFNENENLTFPQAVRSLSERAGVKIPEANKRMRRLKMPKSPLYKANELAMNFSARILLRQRG